MADVTEIRAAAREHQRALDLQYNGLTPSMLADRWNLSETTVRDIPRAHLRYMEFGKGRTHKRRRYSLADVETFEAWKLSGMQGDPPFAKVA